MNWWLQKSRHKPRFKQFIKLRTNVQNRRNLFNFKKLKWKVLKSKTLKSAKWYGRTKIIDQNKYLLVKYPRKIVSYKKRYRDMLHITQRLKLYYGGLAKTYIKKQIRYFSRKKLNKLNSINHLSFFFSNRFENRLDAVLYTSKFSVSVRNARQLIKNGKILVNKSCIRTPSFIINANDLISINTKDHNLIVANVRRSFFYGNTPIPQHFIINYETLEILVGSTLTQSNISIGFKYYFYFRRIVLDYYRN
jgi:ribosomal protein S4